MVNDSWFVHFLRFLLLALAVGIAGIVVIPALIWYFVMLRHTGRRGRDLLVLCIPVVSLVVATQTLWRASAKNVYWSVRPEYQSKTLFA